MHRLTKFTVAFLSAMLIAAPTLVSTQTPEATPDVAPLPESDSLWGGNFITELPDCDNAELCVLTLTDRGDRDGYYYAVIANGTEQAVYVDRISLILFDGAGEVAAIGHDVAIRPRIISPGGHGLVLFTAEGEFLSDYGYEVEFTHQPSRDVETDITQVRIDHATVRGTAVLGELTNTSSVPLDRIAVEGACLTDNGEVIVRFQGEAVKEPIGAGETVLFSANLYLDFDCTNFIVMAWGIT